MQSKDSLLKKIQIYDFCLTEINLYLDSHPFDQKGLEFYEKYRDLRKAAVDEYTANYGPITIKNVDTSSNYWTWVEDPWPWEMED